MGGRMCAGMALFALLVPLVQGSVTVLKLTVLTDSAVGDGHEQSMLERFAEKYCNTTGFACPTESTSETNPSPSQDSVLYKVDSSADKKWYLYIGCLDSDLFCPGTALRPIETKAKTQSLVELAVNSEGMGDKTIAEWNAEIITVTSVSLEIGDVGKMEVEIGSINLDEEYSITQCDTTRCTTRKVTHVITRPPVASHLQAQTEEMVENYLLDKSWTGAEKEDPHDNIMKDTFANWVFCTEWQSSDAFAAGEQDPATWNGYPPDGSGYDSDPAPRSLDAGDPNFHTTTSNKRGSNVMDYRNATTRAIIGDGINDGCSYTALTG